MKIPANTSLDAPVRIDDELDLIASVIDLRDRDIIELGCGKAQLARNLLARWPGNRVVGLEVDARQHAQNVADPSPGLAFVHAGAQAIPFDDARFDLALMLKSLHHIPLPLIDQALDEAARVLRPGGLLYVSEPVFAGSLNEVIRLFNDEAQVRAAAQEALRRAEASARWEAADEIWFETLVQFRDFDQFRQRMIDVSFAERRLDDATLAEVRRRFEPHMTPEGARFVRPMRVNLLRRRA